MSRVIRILNGFCGVGGNSFYWKDEYLKEEGVICEVVAVESNPKIAEVYKKNNPSHEVIVGCVYDYFEKEYKKFDFVWFSPPCQSHSKMMKFTRHDVVRLPDMRLYGLIVFLQNFFPGSWIVENVVPYYKPLIEPTVRVGRHLFWANFEFSVDDVKRPKGFISKANLQGKKELLDWLGIECEPNIYYEKNHCPVQVLRNCVHPKIGMQVLKSFIKK